MLKRYNRLRRGGLLRTGAGHQGQMGVINPKIAHIDGLVKKRTMLRKKPAGRTPHEDGQHNTQAVGRYIEEVTVAV